MPAYDDSRFAPPAPLALVTLRNPNTGATIQNVSMLIDTGADITLVPSAAVQQIGLTSIPDTFYELAAFDGSKSLAAVIRLELLFSQRTFRGRFLIVEQEIGVLGRNILNALRLLFDGPGLEWQVQRNV